MDRLWSPWRYQYVSKPSPAQSCVFCLPFQEANDDERLIVARGKRNFVLLNLFPYTSGHIMIAPYAHIPGLEHADDETATEMMLLARHGEAVLRRVYNAPGINLGMNIGECAGAGVAGHIHLHVLPRWPGDANFMTTVAETRVMPEDLSITLKRLREAW
jgi:ATP adenylyltransferase